ncbi:MAG: Eco57I restriction-modification methylase domain-containing protein [Faecalibacterium sp.]|nr:Eco57I restriction-modification methylase domain-containing protein [Faecalibacterium sp.]
MGTQNKRFRTIGDLDLKEKEREELQRNIDKAKYNEARKRLGQFATPYKLAREILSYGLTLQNEKEISFLEPAMGTGALYSALLTECSDAAKKIDSAVGVEIDHDFYDAASKLWGDTYINLINADFTELKCSKKVNFLVSNPPYVRHHYIDQRRKEKLFAMIKSEMGFSISGLAGLYCYFILCAHKWLAPNAVCGWLLPSEFMDVNYGNVLKEYLLNDVHLLRIHRYNPQYCKFDDAVVSSCVVWFRNEKISKNYSIEFSYGGTHAKPEVSEFVDKNTLEQKKKWTSFPKRAKENESLSNTDILTLGDFFIIKRGLATGDNDFFILSKKQIDELHLDMKFFTPILPSPRYLRCNEVQKDKDGYPLLDTQYFLLNCDIPEDEVQEKYPIIWNYLNKGKENTAQKYLCKKRRVWYYQEHRAVTPFLCSYMGRKKNENAAPFRFILNHTNAIATNSYLMLYPKTSLSEVMTKTPDALHEIWRALTNIAPDEIESEGRIYGGGLKKIEPKELACVKCLQLTDLWKRALQNKGEKEF